MCINYDLPASVMLHTEFHCNLLIGSGEVYEGFFTVYGRD